MENQLSRTNTLKDKSYKPSPILFVLSGFLFSIISVVGMIFLGPIFIFIPIALFIFMFIRLKSIYKMTGKEVGIRFLYFLLGSGIPVTIIAIWIHQFSKFSML